MNTLHKELLTDSLIVHKIKNNIHLIEEVNFMHIPDGFLATPVNITTAVVSAGFIGMALRETYRKIEPEKIKKGLKQAFWPARMEGLNGFILDGAHNLPAIKRLVAEFNGSKKVHILFSALQRKDFHEMIALLQTIPNVSLTLTTFDYPKTIVAADVADISDVTWLEDWRDFVTAPRHADDIYLLTGSLYFMSQVREFLLTSNKSNLKK